MNRVVIFAKGNQVMMQHEHLQKHPSGNGDQRRKQMRNGWKPEWVKSAQPTEIDELALFNSGIQIMPGMNMLSPAPEIAEAAMIAALAERAIEDSAADREICRQLEEREFCHSSGLISETNNWDKLLDQKSEPINIDDETNSDWLHERRQGGKRFPVPAHTCVDQPAQPCANPYCLHKPVTA